MILLTETYFQIDSLRSFLRKNCHLEYSPNSLKLKSWYVMPIPNVSEKAFIFLIENYPENAFKGNIIKLILHENYCLDRNLLSNQFVGFVPIGKFRIWYAVEILSS